MNPLALLFTVVMAALVWSLPKRWVALPFLMGAGYIPVTEELALGPLHFPVTRILVTVGFFRTLSKGERLAGGMNILDRIMIAWGVCAVVTSLFHVSGELISRLGMAYTALGTYFLFRIFIQDQEDFFNVFKIVCIVFIPLALSMLLEKATGRNSFSLLGGPETATTRHGKFRAQGPFAHAILAGTAGAACLPMALLWWQRNRKIALIGTIATGSIIFASGASGPVMTALTIFLGLGLWKIKQHLSKIRWAGVALILILSVAMKDPIYYLIARIDITGGSTGWHRAALIDAAINHFSTWWMFGTDYTRNWMPSGVFWNPNHTDITNHYLQMGVWGGMPLMLVFIAVVWIAFLEVGRALRQTEDGPTEQRFLIWALGAMLFGHATNFLSVSYFDQSITFVYLLLANIGCLRAMIANSESDLSENEELSEGQENPILEAPQHDANLCHNS